MTALAIVIFVLGIMALRRAHRWHHGYYGYGWHGSYGHGCHSHRWGRWHGRHVRERMMLHWLFSRIDASPAQERAMHPQAILELAKHENVIVTDNVSDALTKAKDLNLMTFVTGSLFVVAEARALLQQF